MLLCPPARATTRTSLERLAIEATSLDADEFSSSDDDADDTSPPCEVPKRKSLSKRIDTEHPGSRSARLARRLPSVAGGSQSLKLPRRSLAAIDPSFFMTADRSSPDVSADPQMPPSPADPRKQMKGVAEAAANGTSLAEPVLGTAWAEPAIAQWTEPVGWAHEPFAPGWAFTGSWTGGAVPPMMVCPQPSVLVRMPVQMAPPMYYEYVQQVPPMHYEYPMHAFSPAGQPVGWPPIPQQMAPLPQPPGSSVPWGSLVATAMDAKGSRALQRLLPTLRDEELSAAAGELAPHLCSLAQHAFGNYLVSKLASLPLVRPALAAAFRAHMVSLLCHAQGSRVVQAFLAAAAPAEAEALVSELDGRVVECALDTHGSWGVCVAYSTTRAPFVLRQLSAAVVRLSLEQHGSRVVQYVLKEAGNAGTDCSAAFDRILGGGLEELALHRFANYAVQVALRQCGAGQRNAMLGALLPRLLPLSASKHGSNVAEVVLSLASPDQLDAAAEPIFGGGDEAPAALRRLLQHQFGNYVLQTLLRRLADGPRRAAAFAKVREATSAENYGRSVLSRLGEVEVA